MCVKVAHARQLKYECLTGFRHTDWSARGRPTQTEADQLLSPHDQAEMAALRKRMAKLENVEQSLLANLAVLAYL